MIRHLCVCIHVFSMYVSLQVKNNDWKIIIMHYTVLLTLDSIVVKKKKKTLDTIVLLVFSTEPWFVWTFIYVLVLIECQT